MVFGCGGTIEATSCSGGAARASDSWGSAAAVGAASSIGLSFGLTLDISSSH
jgi:hypothetical protein